MAFYVEPTSPLSPMKLVRTPGFRRDLARGCAERARARLMPGADVLLVSLGSTAGLRASDAAFASALRRGRGRRSRWSPPRRSGRCARSR